MPYVTCIFCGKGGIQALDIGICSECLKRNDDRIRILAIKNYLELFPDAKLSEISNNLGIKMDILNRLIDEGSLQIIYDENGERKILNKSKDENAWEKKRKQFIKDMNVYRNNNNMTTKNPNIKKSRLVEDLNKLYGNKYDER